MNQTISNTRMAQFAGQIVEQVKSLLAARESDMLKAWHENIQEATINEKPFPPLAIGISARIDLEAAKIETSLAFKANYKSTESAMIDDPNQTKLDI